MTLDNADVRQVREQIALLQQSIDHERQHIADILKRKEWANRFRATYQTLTTYDEEAQKAGRQWAALGSNRADINMYDRLAPLYTPATRIDLLKELLAAAREYFNTCQETVIRTSQTRDDLATQSDVAIQRERDAEEILMQRTADIHASFRLEATLSTLEKHLKQNESLLSQAQLKLNEKTHKLDEIRHQEVEARRQLEEANTLVQSLTVHSSMLNLYDLVKDKLAAMQKESSVNARLVERQKNCVRNIELLNQNLRQRELELVDIRRELDAYASKLLLLNQSADTALDVVRAPIVRDTMESQQQLDRFLDLRIQIRALEEQSHLAKMQVNSKVEQITDLHTQVAVEESHRLDIEQSLRENNSELSALYTDLDKIITLSGWFSEWQHNPDSLRSRISTLYHSWEDAKNHQAEISRSISLLRQNLSAAETGVAEARQEESQMRNMRDAVRREIEDHTERLRLTIGTASAHNLSQSLYDDLHQASESRKTILERFYNARKEHAQAKKALEDADRTVQDLQERLRATSASIDLWIENNNKLSDAILQRPVVDEVLAKKVDWVSLRAEMHEAELQKVMSEARMEEAQNAITQLQREAASDHPGLSDEPEALNAAIAQATENLARMEAELHEAQGKLYAHDAALRRIANLHHSSL